MGVAATRSSGKTRPLYNEGAGFELQAMLQALDTEIEPEVLADIDTIIEPVKNTFWRSGRLENDDVQD